METHLGPASRGFDAIEFFLVIALAFGLSIAGSIVAALSYSYEPVEFGDAALWSVLVYEIPAAAVIAFLLHRRGWRWSDFAIHYSRGATILGVVMAVAVALAWLLLELVVGKSPNVPTAGMAAIAAVSVLNPVYEEVLVLGYVVQALRKRFGLFAAMNVSLAIRLAYHLYQGPSAVIPIALFGLVMTLVYVRLGRLWPAIVAHGLLDFASLSGLID